MGGETGSRSSAAIIGLGKGVEKRYVHRRSVHSIVCDRQALTLQPASRAAPRSPPALAAAEDPCCSRLIDDSGLCACCAMFLLALVLALTLALGHALLAFALARGLASGIAIGLAVALG